MEENTVSQWLVITVAVLLIAAGFFLASPNTDRAMPRAAVVPTMQPTPAIVVPTPQPTVAVVYESSVTYVNVNQNVNVCIGLCR